MEITKLTIEGADIDYLTDALKNEFKIDCAYFGDTIAILYFEKFYFRTSSDLLATIVLNFTKNNQCETVIISGGGGVGIMGIKWGSERSINKKIVTFLEKVCKDKSWSILRNS